jgi:protein-disulfide isomerase
VERVGQELKAGVYSDRVQSDFGSGVRSGVHGTPTFFVNGQRFDGRWDFEGLMAAIQRAGRPPVAKRVASRKVSD